MSLVWHIVRKDLRRLRRPLTIWLVALLVHTVLLTRTAGMTVTTPATFESLRYFSGTMGAIVAGVGFILAAWLVMEDSLVDTRAFWLTRPINGARLLAAKVLGALVMFSILPALVLTPWWLWCGFGPRELGRAAFDFALGQGLLSMAAFVLACITVTSGQFLVRLMGAAVLLPVYLNYVFGGFASSVISAGVVLSRYSLVFGLLLFTPAVMLVHQFLTRRTWRTAVLGGCGLVLMLGVRLAWAWDISPQTDRLEPQGEDRLIGFEQASSIVVSAGTPEGRVQIRLQGRTTDVPAGTYVRVDHARGAWVSAGGREPLTRLLRAPVGSGHPPEEAVRQVARQARGSASTGSWEIDGGEPTKAVERARTGGAILQLAMKATLMRGQILGELPLRTGAELQVGASRTRVAAVEWTDGKVIVRLEERDACRGLAESFSNEVVPAYESGRPAEDAYLLLHRPSGHEQVLPLGEIGSVRINSIRVGLREFALEPPEKEGKEITDWAESAVLVKVRFLPDHSFNKSVTARFPGATSNASP